MAPESYKKLEDNILMFYIGGTHYASAILKEQSDNVKKVDKAEVQNKMCAITRTLKDELQKNNVNAMGELLHENWILKKSLVSNISNSLIDDTYEKALKAGATGGKLLGAGGAGFMIFYVPDKKKKAVRSALSDLREMNFEMDNSGTSVVHVDKENI